MSVVCRFAPSPTGALHVGGARTALFNWAFARHHNGQFLLRIEDTDKERSTAANEKIILDALAWLELNPDGELVRQSERGQYYQEVAAQLVEQGKAYRCYATVAELEQLRAEQEARGEKPRYDRRWRQRTDYPANQEYVIRFATALTGDTVLDDLIRGQVTMANTELDDLILLRADGSATYNFAAVVDDIAMGITHVIRGEDHITNTIRQLQIHQALGSTQIKFAHLPLILGRKVATDGTPLTNDAGEAVYERLSKRNQAVDVEHYRQAGFLPAALNNYLAQLGWTQPGTEIYSLAELAKEFDITKVNRSAARFDLDRLRWLNQQYLRQLEAPTLAKLSGIDTTAEVFSIACEKAMTIAEVQSELAWLQAPTAVPDDLLGQLTEHNQEAFGKLCQQLVSLTDFNHASIKACIKACAKEHELGFGKLGMPLRVALTGQEHSPDIAQVAAIIGPEQLQTRLARWL